MRMHESDPERPDWAALYRADLAADYPEALNRLYREPVEAGDGRALLDALMFLCISRIEMPDWLRYALGNAINLYQNHWEKTLDDAFNVKRPDGYRGPQERNRRVLGPKVTADIVLLVGAGAIVDDSLFAAVGKLHGVGSTTVKKWYYASFDYQFHLALRPSRTDSPDSLPSHLRALKPSIKWRDE